MVYQKNLTGKILRFLEQQNNFMISAHVNADGDAVASVIAVYMLLERFGKNAVMILHDEKVDNRFNYLQYQIPVLRLHAECGQNI